MEAESAMWGWGIGKWRDAGWRVPKYKLGKISFTNVVMAMKNDNVLFILK